MATIKFDTSGDTFSVKNDAWSTMNYSNPSSGTYSVQVDSAFTSGSGGTAGNECNESLKHSNAQKGVFHTVKGAVRQVYDTDEKRPVEDVGQYDDALHIAGHAGRAFLTTEDRDYDPEESEPYLTDEFDPANRDRVDVIRDALRRAWSKIDGGNHVGGARIAVSVADHYLEAFEAP